MWQYGKADMRCFMGHIAYIFCTVGSKYGKNELLLKGYYIHSYWMAVPALNVNDLSRHTSSCWHFFSIMVLIMCCQVKKYVSLAKFVNISTKYPCCSWIHNMPTCIRLLLSFWFAGLEYLSTLNISQELQDEKFN